MSNILNTVEFLSFASVVITGLATVFGWATRNLFKMVKRFNLFFNDFYGEPARLGVPAKIGVIERIAGLETISSLNHQMIQQVLAETTANHGSSMRDDITRIHKATTGEPSPASTPEFRSGQFSDPSHIGGV